MSEIKRPCTHPGCTALVSIGNGPKCERHKRQDRRERDQRRGSSYQRGYTRDWKAARDQYLRLHPLCVECHRQGKIIPAIVVDHIVPHKGNMKLFWDQMNWQALCHRHHNIKTAQEDGGFGNKRRIA